MSNSPQWILGVALAFGLAGTASAEIISQHAGSANPTTEGFVRNGGTTTEGPVAGPPAAWNITSTRTGGPSYNDSVSAAQNLDAFSNGWVLSANVRVNDVDQPLVNGDLGANVEYATDGLSGSQRWFLSFGADANGDPQVKVGFQAQPVYTVVGGAGNYNLYELVYDPTAVNADLFVNGSEVMSDITAPNTSNLSRVFFGGNNGGNASQPSRNVDYALVQLESVPEPSSLGIIGLTGLLGLARSRRRAGR